MLRRLAIVLGVAFIAAAVACGSETPDVDALQRDLRQEYPNAQLKVSFINTSHHLELTVDTAVYGNYRLDDSQRRALGAVVMAVVFIPGMGLFFGIWPA